MNKKEEQNFANTKENTALLAISGGLDSICLLYLLGSSLTKEPVKNPSKLEGLIQNFLKEHPISKLELAYIDHGQRDDTNQDIQAIEQVIQKLDVKPSLHTIQLNLPEKTSEEFARNARYQALRDLQKEYKLKYLITAHHSDDVIETALINLSRGTGPKGLYSLSHQPKDIWRPLISQTNSKLYIFKNDLIDYALKKRLNWHEDSTNSSPQYLRNRLRLKLKTTEQTTNLKHKMLTIISELSSNRAETEELLQQLDLSLQSGKNLYSRQILKQLTSDVQKSFLHLKLSQVGFDVNKKSVQLALDFILTKQKGKVLQLKGCEIHILNKETFCFVPLLKK